MPLSRIDHTGRASPLYSKSKRCKGIRDSRKVSAPHDSDPPGIDVMVCDSRASSSWKVLGTRSQASL